jgi:hypothetical protein
MILRVIHVLNFVCVHKTPWSASATTAGVAKRLSDIGGVVDVLEAWEASS